LASVQALARDLGAGQGVLIYPEGTRFSAKKLEASLQRLAKGERQDLYRLAQELRQVLPPRLGGPLALLDAAPDADVLMLAHCGLEGASTLRGFWSGALLGQVLKVRITRIPRASIPSEGRDVWLFERWAELDRWVTSQGGNTENSCS
jgi:1-acyl-sn-glycerol-3-phosphate acyltransferase